MGNLGILTTEQEKTISNLLDNAIKFNGIIEFLDGYIFKAIITYIDDKYADQLDAKLKSQLTELATAVLAKDIELSETLAANIINSLVNIPGLDEEDQTLIFKGILEFLVGVILKWVKDKKAAKLNPIANIDTKPLVIIKK
jgi:hypothetical protein